MNKVSNSVKYIDLSLISQKILFFLSSFLLIFILLTVSAPKAGAANFNGSDFIASELNTQVLNHQLYYFLTSCFAQRNMDKVTVNDDKNEISNWQWLNEEGPSAFRGDMYKNSLARCDGGYLEEAFGRFDLASNPLDTFCRLGFTYNKKTGGNGDGGSTEDCKRGVNQDDFDGSGSQENQRDDVESLLSSTSSGKAAKASLSDEAEYIRYFRTFTNGCQASPVEPYSGGAANNSTAYKITRVDKDGNAEEWYYSSKITDGTKMNLVATRTTSELTVDKGKKITCGQLATALHASSPFPKAYVKWIGSQETPPEGAATTSQDDPNAVVGTDTSCDITGVGWIVCPALSFMGALNDSAYGFLNDFLEVEAKLFADQDTRAAWTTFRDAANVAFVIAFLIIIYSQISGQGITNYGIKRIIPRVIVAAILVNLSYFLCQAAVDLSNIVGGSVYGFFKDVPSGATTIDELSNGLSWQETIGYVLAAGAAVIAALLLASVLGTAAILAFALVIVILVARKALLILLVVISPLAFVAYLLPNTEDWFKKWWKLFSALLLVYPVVGVLFGASTLAARIVNNAGGSTDDSNVMVQLTALGILAVPLFTVPVVLKGALAAAGSIGQKMSSLQDRANKSALNSAKSGRSGEALQHYKNKRGVKRAERRLGKGKGIRSRANRAFDRTSLAKRMGSERGQAAAISDVAEDWDKTVKMQQGLYSYNGASEDQLSKDMNDKNLSDEKRAAAAGMMMKGSRAAQNRAIRDAVKLADPKNNDQEAAKEIQKQMSEDMGSRKPLGLSDSASSELRRGSLGKDSDGQPDGTGLGYNYDDQIASRAVTKVSAAKIPDLDIGDIEEVHRLVKSGKIEGNELASLQQKITEAYGDERINLRIDDKARGYLDDIHAHQTPTPIAEPEPLSNP